MQFNEENIVLGFAVIVAVLYILMWLVVHKMAKPYNTKKYKENLEKSEKIELEKTKELYESLGQTVEIDELPLREFRHTDFDGTNYILFIIIAMSVRGIFDRLPNLLFYDFMWVFIATLPISSIYCAYITFRSNSGKKIDWIGILKLSILDFWVVFGFCSIILLIR